MNINTINQVIVGMDLFQEETFHLKELRKRIEKILITNGIEVSWLYVTCEYETVKLRSEKKSVKDIFYQRLKP